MKYKHKRKIKKCMVGENHGLDFSKSIEHLRIDKLSRDKK